DDHAGKVMTRKTKLIGNALSLGMLLGFLGGMALLLWGLMTAFPDHPPEGGVSPNTMRFGITLIVFGGIWFAVSLTVVLIDPSFFGNRYVRKKLCRELARRSS